MNEGNCQSEAMDEWMMVVVKLEVEVEPLDSVLFLLILFFQEHVDMFRDFSPFDLHVSELKKKRRN